MALGCSARKTVLKSQPGSQKLYDLGPGELTRHSGHSRTNIAERPMKGLTESRPGVGRGSRSLTELSLLPPHFVLVIFDFDVLFLLLLAEAEGFKAGGVGVISINHI